MRKNQLIKFDSLEEEYFSWWLDELQQAGYVGSYIAQPDSYVLSTPFFYEFDKQLKTKTKVVIKKFVREHLYSADFLVQFTQKAKGLFFCCLDDRVDLKQFPFIADERGVSIVEIKPAFSKYNSQREFAINQKFMLDKHGIYVNKIIISNGTKGLFAKTFCPVKYIVTDKTNKKRKLHFKPFTLNEFIAGKNGKT